MGHGHLRNPLSPWDGGSTEHTHIFFGEQIILSAAGVQHEDPLALFFLPCPSCNGLKDFKQHAKFAVAYFKNWHMDAGIFLNLQTMF